MPTATYTLPDFIIIGANKAGTTSVASYLTQHPEICISKVKEPMFFSSDPARASAGLKNATLANPYFAITLDEYSGMFNAASDRVRFFGEASTSYLANPRQSAQLIKKIVPDVKIIAILREPASRAISAYKMCYGNGIENRPFAEVVSEIDTQGRILDRHGVKEYVRNGLYSQLLRPYVSFFDRQNLLFVKYDELAEMPDKVMGLILEFIGASPYQFDTSVKSNTESDHLKDPVAIEEEHVRRLRSFFRDDIRATQDMTSLDLSSWLRQ